MANTEPRAPIDIRPHMERVSAVLDLEWAIAMRVRGSVMVPVFSRVEALHAISTRLVRTALGPLLREGDE